MQPISRHQCLIHDGSPSQQLRAIAKVARKKLAENHRCIYLNSGPMIDLMRACLRAEGVEVESEIAKGALVLTAELSHLVDGHFSVDAMMEMLATALNQATKDGYKGLWATGDMTWEFGPEQDFSKLMEYECRLEKFMQANPRLCGICQYHVNSLSQHTIRQGILSHGRIFVNETLSLMNENFIPCASLAQQQSHFQVLDKLVDRLLETHSSF
jgi:MEDS: MEthanogen/methylotroph, DcmR Sensory domain